MSRFNLVDEPWISVIAERTGGTEEVSLKTLFENARHYQRIAGDTATQDFAVLRVLLAVLHTVFSRVDAEGKPYEGLTLDERFRQMSIIEDEDELEDYGEALFRTWRELWQAGEFPGAVGDYLEKWHDRFDLLDDTYPFFQVTEADMAPEKISKSTPSTFSGKNINRLISESDNKIALFSPKTADEKGILTPQECARWLITFQGYTGLSDKVIFGKEKYKASKGWLFDIGGIFIEGRNLFETLMLNFLLPHTEEAYQATPQTPCWEYSGDEIIQRAFSGRDHDNLAGLYTNWSRAVFIDPDMDFAAPFACSIVKLPDIRHENNFLEPMTIWQYNSRGPLKDTFTPRKHRVNQAIWRSFGLLSLPNAYRGENQRQPGIIEWLNKIAPIAGSYDVTLRAVSMEDDGNATSWVPVDEITDAMRINDLVLTDIRENGWAPRISDTIEETKAAVEGTYRRLLRGIGEIRNVNSTLFVDEEVERLYYQIDRPFNQWLSELRAGDSMDDRIFAWRGILKRIILQQAERLIENAGPRDYTGIVADNKVKNIATVYNSFIYFLNQQIKLKEEAHGEDTAG
ncbi:MAG: type I-E CRISPR-associated protein Cse1/CasA [Christensenellales bacterium]|jgi:CRISPR system Cascade subunit CasA